MADKGTNSTIITVTVAAVAIYAAWKLIKAPKAQAATGGAGGVGGNYYAPYGQSTQAPQSSMPKLSASFDPGSAKQPQSQSQATQAPGGDPYAKTDYGLTAAYNPDIAEGKANAFNQAAYDAAWKADPTNAAPFGDLNSPPTWTQSFVDSIFGPPNNPTVGVPDWSSSSSNDDGWQEMFNSLFDGFTGDGGNSNYSLSDNSEYSSDLSAPGAFIDDQNNGSMDALMAQNDGFDPYSMMNDDTGAISTYIPGEGWTGGDGGPDGGGDFGGGDFGGGDFGNEYV